MCTCLCTSINVCTSKLRHSKGEVSKLNNMGYTQKVFFLECLFLTPENMYGYAYECIDYESSEALL